MRRGKLLPREKKILSSLGENIKLARLRRKLSAKMVAERANISRTTLWNLEKGETNSSLTSMLQVLSVLGLENDLLVVASIDLLGRKLQDAKLITKKRAPKKGKLP
jgi:transcriptional regulator with XRE-family HTH domain